MGATEVGRKPIADLTEIEHLFASEGGTAAPASRASGAWRVY